MASPVRDKDGNVISYPDPADLPGRGGAVPVEREKDRPRRRPKPPVGKPSSGYGIKNVNTNTGGNVTIGDVGSNNVTNVGSGSARAEAKERVKKYKEKKEDDVDTTVTPPDYEKGGERDPVTDLPTDLPSKAPIANPPSEKDLRDQTSWRNGTGAGTGQYVEKPPSFVGDGVQTRDGVLRREANKEARMEQRLANKDARQAERAERRSQRKEARMERNLDRQQKDLATFDPRAVFTEYRGQFDDPRRRNQPTGPISSTYNGGYSFR